MVESVSVLLVSIAAVLTAIDTNIYSSYNKEIMEATAAIAATIRDATERTV